MGIVTTLPRLEKKPKEKYIMVSQGCYGKISRLQTKLQKIYGKKISFGKVIETLFAIEVDWSDLTHD
jgi:hypothetical protein